MKPATLLAAIMTATSVEAYKVRLGWIIDTPPGPPVNYCTPLIKVLNDNWGFVGQRQFNNRRHVCTSHMFCAQAGGCPVQAEGLEIGVRVMQDGGSDQKIRVEAWKGSKSTWSWCEQRNAWDSGNIEYRWLCDFNL
ncbi:hypothetical protein QBC44DRAFT_374155 [Cladorrhinum sp. PSN332]|nr:hypothetical protein QBC44DRAFT_374155 [Cladorrhinum sp. PSN332]